MPETYRARASAGLAGAGVLVVCNVRFRDCVGRESRSQDSYFACGARLVRTIRARSGFPHDVNIFHEARGLAGPGEPASFQLLRFSRGPGRARRVFLACGSFSLLRADRVTLGEGDGWNPPTKPRSGLYHREANTYSTFSGLHHAGNHVRKRIDRA